MTESFNFFSLGTNVSGFSISILNLVANCESETEPMGPMNPTTPFSSCVNKGKRQENLYVTTVLVQDSGTWVADDVENYG